MKVVAAFAAALGCAALAGCSAAEADPAPLPVTVASVQSVQDVTLSTGQRIHNTGLGGADSYGSTPREQCEAAYDLGAARSLLTGRQVVDAKVWRQWDGATPGYTPAKLRFATGRVGGDDLAGVWNSTEVNAGRAAACPVTEQAPLSGSQVTAGPGSDTYVDVDRDGKSRFCRRHWFC